jgi:hypothetical protein
MLNLAPRPLQKADPLHILIVEDNTQDAILAAEIARELGITSITLKSAASPAKVHLETALDGKISLPDIILLDRSRV